MDWVVVREMHVFLEWVVHERQAIIAAQSFLLCIDLVTPVLEPLNLVSLDAVHSAMTHAVSATSAKEPQPGVNDLVVFCILNRNIIGELVFNLLFPFKFDDLKN